MTRRHWLIAVVVLGLEVLFVLLVRTPPAMNVNRSDAADEWHAPRSPEAFDASAALSLLAESPVWGDQTAAVEEPPAGPAWRLIGVSTGGEHKTALVSVEGEAVQTLSIGQELPEGSEILDIREDGICIEIDGKLMRLPVNDTEPQACGDPIQ